MSANINFEEVPTTKPNKKADKHSAICNQLHDTYRRKNADYGDSFGKQFKEYGLTSSAIRLEDKFSRFKNLIKQQALVQDEKMEDTLLDMANYCIMTVIELQGEEVEESEVKVIKEKKGLATKIEYNQQEYALVHPDTRRG